MKLDKALAKLNNPQQIGEKITGLPCELCDKNHTRVIGVQVDNFLVWEIHSPCLDKIAKMAVGYIG